MYFSFRDLTWVWTLRSWPEIRFKSGLFGFQPWCGQLQPIQSVFGPNTNLGWVSPKIYFNWAQVISDNEYLDTYSFEHCHNNSCGYNIPNMCLFEKKTTRYANLDWSSSGSYASNPIYEHHLVTCFWKWKLILWVNVHRWYT